MKTMPPCAAILPGDTTDAPTDDLAPSAARHAARRAMPLAAAAVLIVIAAAFLYCLHLGYPRGQIYRLVPATAQAGNAGHGTVAVFFSGDMGFNAGMGPPIAEQIARQGVPVLGVNSLTAFAYRQTPAAVTALVRDAVMRALALPGTQRVVLIGHSFGANAVLSGFQGLPAQLKARIPLVELVVPGDTMLFRAFPGGIFEPTDDGPALPVARRIAATPVLCIHGEIERHSLCPLWNAGNVRRVALPGGHSLQKDSSLVAAVLLRAIAIHTPR
jgi:type IV secretory pathway VirJ component